MMVTQGQKRKPGPTRRAIGAKIENLRKGNLRKAILGYLNYFGKKDFKSR
jgi:hypothetical protein